MKTYMKIALISLSIAGTSLLANDQDAINNIQQFKNVFTTFKNSMTAICLNGDKNGIAHLIALEKQLLENPMQSSTSELGQATQQVYNKFTQIVLRICSIFKSNKPLTEITLDLTTNFDVKKLFPEAMSDLQKLLAIAHKNNDTQLAGMLEEVIKEIQAEQAKWANQKSPTTVLSKLMQSIKAYFKR